MLVQKQFALDDFLNLPEVKEIIREENRALAARRQSMPPICKVFDGPFTRLEENRQIRFEIDNETRRKLPTLIHNAVQKVCEANAPDEAFRRAYQRRRNIGIVFSGGPAPGGHNVIAGIYKAAKKANADSRIFGFWMGPDGIIENQVVELSEKIVDAHLNTGGFGMIKTGRTKIDTPEKMELSRATCQQLGLDALVIVGGDDSNTNAAFLAHEMLEDGVQVIGVPKTIDGDVQVKDADGNSLCAMSFGFHSAARAFSQNISNLCTDCNSDMKYWHICKVMGRSASHLALEVALQTHANMTLIGEDLADYEDGERLERARQSGETNFNAFGMTLRHLSRVVCDGIVRRAAVGKNCGVLVIPEGVLEFINEIQVFIIKLNTIIAVYNKTHDQGFHADYPMLEDKLEYLRRLARRAREEKGFSIWNTRDDDLFNDIPAFFQEGLLTERDSHGNFQFSLVETDKVIMGLVRDYLGILWEEGRYKIGIENGYYRQVMEKSGLDAGIYAAALFRNPGEPYLLMKPEVISEKTLNKVLVEAGMLVGEDAPPAAVVKLYKKSVPKFKTQTHFYGYDGRGSHPTQFDCNYTYNLGLTVFSLIANGATGQMAAIRNLELDFDHWEPIGIPIAPLMHLEERKGKLSLVLEKSLVDIHSSAFRLLKACREKWLAAQPGPDRYRSPAPIHLSGSVEEDRPLTLFLNSLGQVIN